MKGLEITSEAATISALTLASTAAAAAAEAASLTCPVTSAGCLLIAPCTTAATTFAADVALRKQMNFARDTTIAPSMTCKATDLAPRAAFLTKVTTIASSCPPAAPVPAQVKAEDILINLNSTFTPDTSFADVDSIFIKNQLKPFKFYTQTPQPQINQNYFEKLIHFIMPSAQASTMNLLMGGAGAGAGILIGMVGTMGASVDTFMYASKNRGIMWGVLAGLSFGASKSTDSVISNIDNNIQKIDNILAGMNSLEKGVAIGNNNGSGALPAKNTAVASKQKVKLSHNSSARAISSNPADRISCFGSEGDSNCNSLSNQIEKLPDFKMLPPQLQSLSVDATKLVGGLEGNNKISGSTLGSVEDFGGKQSAVGKMLETSKGRVNKLLAKNKKGGINFAKEEGNVLNGFKNGINKSLRKTNTSPKAFLASIGSGFGNLDKSDEANNENERKSNSSPLNQATVYGIGDERVNGASEFSHKLGGEEFSTDNKDKSASATSSKSNVDNFDITTSDINTNSSQSLFELISARYFKSGYPRLFMKKEEEKVEK